MRAFLLTTCVTFSIIAVAQLARIALAVPLQVGGVSVPVWVSAFPLAIALGLATWAFVLSRDAAWR